MDRYEERQRGDAEASASHKVLVIGLLMQDRAALEEQKKPSSEYIFVVVSQPVKPIVRPSSSVDECHGEYALVLIEINDGIGVDGRHDSATRAMRVDRKRVGRFTDTIEELECVFEQSLAC